MDDNNDYEQLVDLRDALAVARHERDALLAVTRDAAALHRIIGALHYGRMPEDVRKYYEALAAKLVMLSPKLKAEIEKK